MDLSWNSVAVFLKDTSDNILTGYFSVDSSTNIVQQFYQIIDGSANYDNNILMPPGSQMSYYSRPQEFNNNVYDISTNYFSNGGIAVKVSLNVLGCSISSIQMVYSNYRNLVGIDSTEYLLFYLDGNVGYLASNGYTYTIQSIDTPEGIPILPIVPETDLSSNIIPIPIDNPINPILPLVPESDLSSNIINIPIDNTIADNSGN